MSRSRIFEEYARVALDQGIVKQADEKEKPKTRTDISAIEVLYGVQPNGKDDEKNMVEQAHPEPAVTFMSYDALNSLVENEVERHNISVHLVQKMPEGFHDNRKYAHNALLLNLVRLGNELDNCNQDELRALADTCVSGLDKKFEKVAVLPAILLAIPAMYWVGAAATALAYTYYVNHSSYADSGFTVNLKNAIKQLKGLIDDSGWFDTSLSDTFKGNVVELISKLEKLETLSDEFLKAKSTTFEKPSTLEELKTLTQTPAFAATIDKFNKFRSAIVNLEPVIVFYIEKLDNEDFKKQQQKQDGASGFLGDTSRFIERVFHGGYGLFSDKFDKAKQALQTFESSLVAEKKFLETVLSKEGKYTNVLENKVLKDEEARKAKEAEELKAKEEASKAQANPQAGPQAVPQPDKETEQPFSMNVDE